MGTLNDERDPTGTGEAPGADISGLVSMLQKVQQEVDAATGLLQSPQIGAILGKGLHEPDRLPDKHLDQTCSLLVDSLDRLQMLLTPSTSLLADGFFGYLLTKATWTLVDAHVADLLREKGALSASELGEGSGVQPERLCQLLDTLIHVGIFSYDSTSRKYENNRVSLLLCHDHWTQWHLWADLYGNDFFNVSRAMPQAVKIGENRSAAQIEYGTDLSIFEYLSQQGLIGKFHKTLGAGAVAQAIGLTVDYPWEDLGSDTFIDIGGGSGEFLASILRAHSDMTGSLMDLQHVVDIVTPEFRNPSGKFADIAHRVKDIHAGDFLKEVPHSSIYTMKWCLHDWTDEDVVKIFRNVRRSIKESPVSRLLVLESVKQLGRSSRIPHYGDLIMMITANGKERSREDWTVLAERAGWHVHAIHPVRRAWPVVIDLRPIPLTH